MKHHTDQLKGLLSENSKCVVGFDIWGTLLDLNKLLEIIALTISRKIDIDFETSKKAVFAAHEEARNFRRVNPDATPLELLYISRETLARKFNLPASSITSIIDEAFESAGNFVVFEDAVPAIEALKERGVSMGIVGNVLFWPSDLTIKLLDKVKLLKYMKVLVFSDKVGFSKPDRRIFLVFAKQMGVKPDRVIYVGDNVIEDVGGALSAGFMGILVNRKSDIKKLYVRELHVGLVNSLLELPNSIRRSVRVNLN